MCQCVSKNNIFARVYPLYQYIQYNGKKIHASFQLLIQHILQKKEDIWKIVLVAC